MNLFPKKITSQLDNLDMMSFQERVERSSALKEKYPHCVPVIVRKNKNDKILQDEIQSRYLIPKNVEISYLLISIQKKLKIDANKALFVFVQQNNNSSFLVTPSMNIQEIYNSYGSSDGFLYLIYTTENTFG